MRFAGKKVLYRRQRDRGLSGFLPQSQILFGRAADLWIFPVGYLIYHPRLLKSDLQRIERRFPKTKTGISSDFISSRLSYANYISLVACTGTFVIPRHQECAHFYASG
jgi:hypothetical protein